MFCPELPKADLTDLVKSEGETGECGRMLGEGDPPSPQGTVLCVSLRNEPEPAGQS